MILRNVPRQKTPFTCGPACLQAIVYILEETREKDKVIDDLCLADPINGTPNHRMISLANLLFNDVTFGENCWNGSLAIANIRNIISGNGHFVVFLRRENRNIVFYDPYFGKTFSIPESEIYWQSGCGTFNQWCINIPTNKIIPDILLSEKTDQHPEGDLSNEWKLNTVNKKINTLELK